MTRTIRFGAITLTTLTLTLLNVPHAGDANAAVPAALPATPVAITTNLDIPLMCLDATAKTVATIEHGAAYVETTCANS